MTKRVAKRRVQETWVFLGLFLLHAAVQQEVNITSGDFTLPTSTEHVTSGEKEQSIFTAFEPTIVMKVPHKEELEMKLFEKKCGNDSTTDLRCGCDPDCAIYGDCCLDSTYFKSEEQKLGASLAICSSIHDPPIYIMSRCPSAWDDTEIRQRCEHPDCSYPNPMLDTAITSLRTNVTYGNSYCASCHRDLHQDMFRWPLEIECNLDPSTIRNCDVSRVFEYMLYDEKWSSWYLNLRGFKSTCETKTCIVCSKSLVLQNNRTAYNTNCTPPRIPAPIYAKEDIEGFCKLREVSNALPMLEGRLRYCEHSISWCAHGWNDIVEKESCKAYSSHVYSCWSTYRNYHCAICNNETRRPSPCPTWSVSSTPPPFTEPKFSTLIDWRRADQCGDFAVLDKLSNQCRKSLLYYTAGNGIFMEDDACTNVTLSPSEYIMGKENDMVFVPAHNTTYTEQKFFVQDDYLVLCVPGTPEGQFAPELGYITVVGLSLSIACIVLHLTVLCIAPKLCNLPAINLVSLCVSLLLLYSSFMLSESLTPRTTFCFAIAVIIHYSLLASFCWMFIISFDVFNMMQQTKKLLEVSKGMKLRTFCIYSACGWLIPTPVVGLALAFDYTYPTSSFSPAYGVRKCWFGHSNALLVFCLTPLILVMCLNVVFFFWTSYLIRQMAQFQNSSFALESIKLNTRLFIIMGLTWITGIVASATDIPGLWYVFVVFNTMQGVFIFLAFTCTRKVWQELQSKFQKLPRLKVGST